MTILSMNNAALLKKFKKCINERSIDKMDQKLYRFFMNECGFIAHYNIHGFRAEYSGTAFKQLFLRFSQPNWMFFNQNGQFEELKEACVAYAQQQEAAVIADFERKERNEKLRFVHAIAAELGLEVTNENRRHTPETLLQEANDGQMTLLF